MVTFENIFSTKTTKELEIQYKEKIGKLEMEIEKLKKLICFMEKIIEFYEILHFKVIQLKNT